MTTTVKTIDLTPTWRQTVPMLVLLLREGDATARQFAMGELLRMADALDGAK